MCGTDCVPVHLSQSSARKKALATALNLLLLSLENFVPIDSWLALINYNSNNDDDDDYD